MTRDAWIGVVFLAFAVVYWIAADGIRISPLDGPVTAAGLPKSLAYALGGLAVLLIVRSLTLRWLVAGRTAPGEQEEERGPDLRQHLRAVGMLAIGVAYLLAVPYLGYTLSIIALLFAAALYIGARFGPKTAAIAALGGAFFYLLFVQLLGIPLPPGMWPDLLRSLQG
jgi:putative tricarboxylic transport membrane protein